MTPDNQQQVQQAKARFGIVGNAPALLQAVSRALRVAPIDMSVLVIGESGSGKEFFPQIIHSFSSRKHSRYIAVNCGAIPEGTIDSELFGHEKGSFTGALATRKGYFEEADGGTLFLDEVAELPLTTQARLLRVLESGEFMKVGSSVVQKTNVRIVAATNVDMERAVREGRFREDLYYRLSAVTLQVPPLRDRGNDIALLARKFASDFAERYRTEAVTFSDGAREALLRYRWPGNVRQLKNVVEKLALFEAGMEISLDTLREYLPQAGASYTPVLKKEAMPEPHSYAQEREMLFSLIFRLQHEIDELRKQIDAGHSRGASQAAPASEFDFHRLMAHPVGEVHRPLDDDSDMTESGNTLIDVPHSEVTLEGRTLEETEKETIRLALERNGGRRKSAARELNISERTLYRKIKEYGLE